MRWLWILLALLVLALFYEAMTLLRKAVCRGSEFPEEQALEGWEHRLGVDTAPLRANLAWFRAQPLQMVTLRSFDGLKLTADYLPVEGESRGRMLLFHGYRGGVRDFSGAIRYYHEAGFDLLVPDQRAHGRSEGQYIGFGVLERRDCRDWVEEANRRFGGDEPTLLAGISMGATTVLMAAGEPFPENVRGIIADCGFTSPEEIITYQMRRLEHLPRWPLYPLTAALARLLAGYGFRDCSTVEAMEQATLPVLFVHGGADTFVPPEMTERNYAACRAEKQLLLVPGAGHGMGFVADGAGYRRELEMLFARCGLPERAEAAVSAEKNS